MHVLFSALGRWWMWEVQQPRGTERAIEGWSGGGDLCCRRRSSENADIPCISSSSSSSSPFPSLLLVVLTNPSGLWRPWKNSCGGEPVQGARRRFDSVDAGIIRGYRGPAAAPEGKMQEWGSVGIAPRFRELPAGRVCWAGSASWRLRKPLHLPSSHRPGSSSACSSPWLELCALPFLISHCAFNFTCGPLWTPNVD